MIPLYLIDVLNNNIYAQIGMVLLIGLAAKKAIMLVEFSRNCRDEGMSIVDAAISAAHTRFRPVTMTGLCFIVGVLPLVFASGAGSASRVSIGLPVFAGMILDSTIGLLMIPVLYVVVQRIREKFTRKPAAKSADVQASSGLEPGHCVACRMRDESKKGKNRTAVLPLNFPVLQPNPATPKSPQMRTHQVVYGDLGFRARGDLPAGPQPCCACRLRWQFPP